MSCYSEGLEVRQSLIREGKVKGKVYVSFSGGKDSTAMLLKLIEKEIYFDEIVFADTGLEFPEIQYYIDFIAKTIGKKITRLVPKEGLWDKWFYGKVTRGEHKGEYRSYPLTVFSCWYKREAKVKPLEKYMKDADIIYIGIASDETKRQKVKDPRIIHPLVEWGMTEEDCAKYLQEQGLHNPYYDKYNRGGCYTCPKQGDYALYMLWKEDRDMWNKTLFYDNEARRLRGKGGFMRKGEEMKLSDLQKKFEEGFIPKNNLKYECHSCKVFGGK